MPIDFPDNPTDNQEFNGYIYNATRGVWDAKLVSSNALNDLSDIDTTGVTDGQTLVYNSSAGQWENGSSGVSLGLVIALGV